MRIAKRSYYYTISAAVIFRGDSDWTMGFELLNVCIRKFIISIAINQFNWGFTQSFEINIMLKQSRLWKNTVRCKAI